MFPNAPRNSLWEIPTDTHTILDLNPKNMVISSGSKTKEEKLLGFTPITFPADFQSSWANKLAYETITTFTGPLFPRRGIVPPVLPSSSAAAPSGSTTNNNGGFVESTNKNEGQKDSSCSLSFSDDVIISLRAVKQFPFNKGSITSMNFSSDGEFLVSSAMNDQICVYNMLNGSVVNAIPSKKYGADLVSFTHERKRIIHASTKIDDTIRYLDVETNKYIRYFPGHHKRVTQLKVNPMGFQVLSAGDDQKLFLWDIRSPHCQGLMNMKGVAVCEFDPEGLLFAVSLDSHTVKLYDLRSFDKGPFSTLILQDVFANEYVHGMKIAPHGLSIMLFGTESKIHIVDAFYGKTIHVIDDLENRGYLLDVNYSPDGSYIFAGSWNGNVHVWKAKTGKKVCILNNVHSPRPLYCVKNNPRYMTLASANDSMVFWNPMVAHYNYFPPL